VQIPFTCSEDDFREAHGARHAPAGKSAGAKVGWRSAVRKIIPAVIVPLAVGLALLGRFSSAPSTPPTLPAGRTLLLRFLGASTLTIGFLIFWSWALIRFLIQPLRKPWELPARRQQWKRLLFTFLLMAVAGVVMTWATGDTSAATAARPTGYEVMLSITPMMAVFVILIVFRQLQGPLTVRRNWASQPFLHRPSILEIDERELTLSEPLSSHRYQWEYFAGYLETENLILLYVSPFAFWIVPKRAFSYEELQAFKALLSTHVAHGILLPMPGRFPVLPPAPADPPTPDRVAP